MYLKRKRSQKSPARVDVRCQIQIDVSRFISHFTPFHTANAPLTAHRFNPAGEDFAEGGRCVNVNTVLPLTVSSTHSERRATRRLPASLASGLHNLAAAPTKPCEGRWDVELLFAAIDDSGLIHTGSSTVSASDGFEGAGKTCGGGFGRGPGEESRWTWRRGGGGVVGSPMVAVRGGREGEKSRHGRAEEERIVVVPPYPRSRGRTAIATAQGEGGGGSSTSEAMSVGDGRSETGGELGTAEGRDIITSRIIPPQLRPDRQRHGAKGGGACRR